MPQRAEVGGCAEGVGVTVAEDLAAAGQGVPVEVMGLLVATQRVAGEVVGCGEGGRVVIAQNPALAGLDVLVEVVGLLVAAQLA